MAKGKRALLGITQTAGYFGLLTTESLLLTIYWPEQHSHGSRQAMEVHCYHVLKQGKAGNLWWVAHMITLP